MRHLLGILMLALLSTAPLAFAQEDAAPKDDPTRPDDAAWTEDCPPDMMCAYDAGNGSAEPGQPLGPDDCIECSTPPKEDGGATCMDGADPGETCDPNVHYMDAPARGPADGSCENCRGETAVESDAAKAVPGAAVALGIIASACAALLVLPRRG